MAHALDDPEKQKKKKKKKENTDNDKEEKEVIDCIIQTTPPPDGGWGWAVVFASFMIHVMTDGVTYSFGVIYYELLYVFGEGKGATAWIASILVGVTLCSGPISSMFVNKFGCRAVTIAGAILSSICLLISVWAQSVFTLYFTIGIGTGLGFGLIYLPAIVCVTVYFEKYRSLATGIAVCGSGVGTIIFAPLIGYLIREYGWRGATMITAGLVLNCIIFGILFRPIEPVKKHKDIMLQEIVKPEEGPLKVPEMNGNTMTNGFGRPHSVSNINQTTYRLDTKNEESKCLMRVTTSHPILFKSPSQHNDHIKSFGSGVMNRKDIFYQRSLENIRDKPTGSLIITENHTIIRSSVQSLPNGIEHKKENEITECLPCTEETLGIFQKMLDVNLLKDPIFILFIVSNFCTSIGFNIPYVYLIPQAVSQSVTKDNADYLLSAVGIANTIGRIVLGYVSDKPWINRLLVYNLCLTICGIATVLSAFCGSFASFVFYASVYGFTIGAYVGLTSVILVDLLGLDRLTNAFGLLLLFQGVASLLGPPIAGWLYDALQSYNPGFFVAGGMIAISGLMLFLIPPLQKRARLREERLKQINNVMF